MKITTEALKKRRENLEAQRQNALILYHQATGAISFVDALLNDESLNAVKKVTRADSVKLVKNR